MRVRPRKPPAVRFWKHVEKTPGCWWWRGHARRTDNNWHGMFRVDIVPAPPVYAHRFSWELHYGPIPIGLKVLHSCDNGLCVRPDHLFLGTLRDNTADMIRKRRHPRQKITLAQAREIRFRYAAENITQKQLAREYGVSKTVIGGVCSGRTFKETLFAHLPPLDSRDGVGKYSTN